MGSTQSVPVVEDDEDEEEEEEDDNGEPSRREMEKHLVKKVLEQEPEILPCHASASPLSPQLSSLGTPRLGPSIKVWDPYTVLAPPPPLPPPPPAFSTSYAIADDVDRTVLEVFLISHGECEVNLRPDLVTGRCPEAALTSTGKRQARALAVFLNSQRVRFNAIYSSPLIRARSMAISICQVISNCAFNYA
jgi:hypothetical protein